MNDASLLGYHDSGYDGGIHLRLSGQFVACAPWDQAWHDESRYAHASQNANEAIGGSSAQVDSTKLCVLDCGLLGQQLHHSNPFLGAGADRDVERAGCGVEAAEVINFSKTFR